jgi:carbon starvation protein
VIDAGTRVGRYVVQELGGYIYKPFADLRSLSANVIASLIVVVSWGYLIYTGSVQTIWRMFGTANQLLGMLALCIGSTLLIKMGKAKYAWVTLVPMTFMASTTFTSSIKLIREYYIKAFSSLPDAGIYKVNMILISIMFLLAVTILVDSMIKWYGYYTKRRPITSTEVITREIALGDRPAS